MPEGRVAVTWEVPGASEKGGLSSTSALKTRLDARAAPLRHRDARVRRDMVMAREEGLAAEVSGGYS